MTVLTEEMVRFLSDLDAHAFQAEIERGEHDNFREHANRCQYPGCMAPSTKYCGEISGFDIACQEYFDLLLAKWRRSA